MKYFKNKVKSSTNKDNWSPKSNLNKWDNKHKDLKISNKKWTYSIKSKAKHFPL